MEDIITNAFQSGNATAIVCALAVYLIIYFQRKNTGTNRDKDYEELKKEISDLKIDNELKQKDIDNLKNESGDIKQDLKEMKMSIQGIQLSLEKISTYYDFLKNTPKTK